MVAPMDKAPLRSHDRSRAQRERIIPLPGHEEGYARVMLVGTTGAGKTTLLRHLIGTDPHRDRFPSTSTAKTTTADIEIVTAEGPFEAVITFASRDQVQADVEDCLYEAGQRVIRGGSDDDIAAALLEHPEQRFRLSYILGAWKQEASIAAEDEQGEFDDFDYGDSDDAADDLADDEIVSAEAIRENNAALRQFVERITELAQSVSEAVEDTEGAYNQLDNERERADWLAEHFAPTLREDADFLDLAEDIMNAIENRFGKMSTGTFVRNDQPGDWPSYWHFDETDRDRFLRQVRWFSSNHHKQFGRLLTPLVDGVRVRGPLYPSSDLHDAGKPRFVLLDGEGLGHSAKEATSVSTRITDRFSDVDLILLVDSAQQPMQAAPLKLLQTVGTAGYSSKLAIAFTHFDQVQGVNLGSGQQKVGHVRASIRNALRSLQDVMSARVSETLEQRSEAHAYFLGELHRPISKIPSGGVRQLQKLLDAMAQSVVQPEPTDLAPIYKIGEFSLGLNRAVENFRTSWRAMLGLQQHAEIDREHWARIKALCRRLAQFGENEYKHLRPVADLINQLQAFISVWLENPARWNKPAARETEEQAAIDRIRQNAFQQIHNVADRRLWREHLEDWEDAYQLSGAGSTRVRADHMMHDIYEPAAPSIEPEPTMDQQMQEFRDEILKAVRDAIEDAGGYLEDA